MRTIAEIINGALSESMISGNRVSYVPYKMDSALSVVNRIGRGLTPLFKINGELEELYSELIRYFHNDPEFKGDLNKGLLIMGPTGTGKTLAMEIMRIYRQIDNTKFVKDGKYYEMRFNIISVNDIVSQFINNSFEGIDPYCERYVLCIDDIGAEIEKVKHYGNSLDVIGHVLSERYAKRLYTFGTTNFPMSVLEDKYDDRTISRMYAMFNFIIMTGSDFRRK
jgi:DNA replication protein DnaC